MKLMQKNLEQVLLNTRHERCTRHVTLEQLKSAARKSGVTVEKA